MFQWFEIKDLEAMKVFLGFGELVDQWSVIN